MRGCGIRHEECKESVGLLSAKQPGMTQPAAAAVSINTKSSQEEQGGYLRGFREREIVM